MCYVVAALLFVQLFFFMCMIYSLVYLENAPDEEGEEENNAEASEICGSVSKNFVT